MSESLASPFLLYGICATSSEDALSSVLQQQSGVGGAPLSLFSVENLAVLQSPVDPSTLQAPETSTVLDYREVVAAAYEARPLVPLRFGTTVDTGAQAQALVARHRSALDEHLARFEGRVEVGVRLTLVEQESTPTASAREAASGQAYLEARRDERGRHAERRTDVMDAYQGAVEPMCVEATCDDKSARDGVLSLAFLVSEAEVEAVCDRLAAVETEAVVEAHVVGPWAPYSFVRL